MSFAHDPVTPSELFAGKRILLSGTTGFLGKVVLSLLLTRYPSIGRIYTLIRPGPSDRAQDRFDKTVATSPALEPVLAAHGPQIFKDKVRPIDGNVIKDDCGISPEVMAELERDGLDLIINSAGLVDFDPAVDQALQINALGTQNVVKLATRLNAALVHVSTCFVAGQRNGQILEDDPVLNQLPDMSDARTDEFDFQREIDRLQELAREVRARAEDPKTKAEWRKEAIATLEEEGRDSSDEHALRSAIMRQKKVWLNIELKRVGMERATFWGWTNTYTFTKSLGEMVVADAAKKGLVASIVRPAIVESALEFPLPGWNEGFTTTAPLILMVRGGLLHFPYAEDLLLDIIPCDMVAGAILAVGAACLKRENKLVYQAASGDVNPLTIKKALELTAFEGRQRARDRDEKGVKGWYRRHYETQPLDKKSFQRMSMPQIKNVAQRVGKTLDDIGPDRLGIWRTPATYVRELAAEVEESSTKINTVLDLFLPFVAENKYVFRCDNTRALMQRIPEAERGNFFWKPESFRWRDYFLKIHIPGLEKWVLPELEEELAEKPKVAYMHRDLIELFESSTHAHRHRVALRYLAKEGATEHLTYGDLRTLARRVSGFITAKGVPADGRVLLVCENRPEWGAAYFGVLRAGCTVVPVDANARTDEIANIARTAAASGVLLSPKVAERIAGAELGAPCWPLEEALRCKDELTQPKSPARVASLIFTSGTTGKPKGVMLSHRNFTFEVSRLAGIFKLDHKDHLLSVLPLHHTFEFTAGLLLPLSRGARITYLQELNGDMLSRALGDDVSGLIGVPALWQLLQRRIESRMNERSELMGLVLDGIKQLNAFVRDNSELNLGPVLAYPVHRSLGGRLKYLVSGGSALNPDVLEFFRGLGFNMTEGYGLTESAPVLTVTSPHEKVVAGSVGKPIHGVEIKIDAPNEDGIGEVLARGPNVMLGYFNDEEASGKVLDNGWLRTGDLGKLDDDGRLYLVGRQKDVIVDADGRNVYPDELEDAYGKHERIKELSIVGLPQPGRGERVACLLVPDYGEASPSKARRDEVRREIQEHIKKAGETLPYYRRIKVLHMVDHDLPRTSTRKVKRAEVVEELTRLQQATSVAGETSREGSPASPVMLARQVVAAVVGKPAAQVAPSARLVADLGFDSLMFVELATALEPHAREDLTTDTLMQVERVSDIAPLLRSGEQRRAAAPVKRAATKAIARTSDEDDAVGPTIPKPLASAGKRLLSWGQRKFYEELMDVDVRGRHYVPRDQGFLVAANHASHLDAGLVKVALGDFGRNLVALAARDYFFGGGIKQFYFENFTNLVPIERHGALKTSMKRALAVLERGQSLLIFPEGTRSPDGKLQPFKSSIGYLGVTSNKPVLPMYLWGTYDAMPKGSTLIPRERRIGAVVGPAIRPEHWARLVEGRPRSEAYRLTAAVVERAVIALRDEGSYKPEVLVEAVLRESAAGVGVEEPAAAHDMAAPEIVPAPSPAVTKLNGNAHPKVNGAHVNGNGASNGNGVAKPKRSKTKPKAKRMPRAAKSTTASKHDEHDA